ncbi:MAG: nitrite reductase (NAD(P)H) small subunit [Bacteroidota bacterium]|nr:nitrite reductase (NAD(P)H) small subunit [Bacteroidota bacterium]
MVEHNSPAFIKITTLDALHEGRGRSVSVEGRDIAVFLIQGVVYAVENLCPHQHIPVLDEGELDGTVVTCPMHGWQFDLATGKHVHSSSRLTKYETRIDGRDVLISLPAEDIEPWW